MFLTDGEAESILFNPFLLSACYDEGSYRLLCRVFLYQGGAIRTAPIRR